jgi:hypothetical protein
MITAVGVQIFLKYKGDDDAFSRSATKSEREQLSNNDWHLIDQLLTRIAIVRDGLAANEYSADTDKLLTDHCANPDAITSLRSLCDKLMPPK